MKKKETVKVYWAPFPFVDNEEQWNMLYMDPKPVADSFYSNLNDEPEIVKCPVIRGSMKNIFSLNSNIEDIIKLDEDLVKKIYNDTSKEIYQIPVESKLPLVRPRASSYKNFININYNMSWIFFSEDSLIMRTSPPTFPVVMPAENSILAFGKIDIGKYYRSINLDYHIPIDTKVFSIKEDQPLIFLEFETDKNIEFVRFKNTPLLKKLENEFSHAPDRWGWGIPLSKRYRMAEKSNILRFISSEIKKNII